MTALASHITERELQAAVVDLARLRQWSIHHDRGDYRQCIAGDAGFPDLCMARSGVVRFFEVKTEKGKLTRDQERWRDALSGVVDEDDDWNYLFTRPRAPTAYAVIRPSRWTSGQVAEVLR